MKILIHVDTNDYNEDGDLGTVNETPEWSSFTLCLATFLQWEVAGQTGFWTIDGEVFCGTAYETEVKYSGLNGEILLRCLVNKIRETCKERLMRIWIDDLEVKFTEDMMEMRPEWVKTIKESC
jgi:hypothetical protein